MARLLFFGKLGDIAQTRTRDITIDDARTISALKAAIKTNDPVLGEALGDPSVRCIVNEEMTQGDAAISDGDEIAFIPPVSGG